MGARSRQRKLAAERLRQWQTSSDKIVAMAQGENEDSPAGKKEERHMEILLLLAFLVGWIVLQVFVLPRFGVST